MPLWLLQWRHGTTQTAESQVNIVALLHHCPSLHQHDFKCHFSWRECVSVCLSAFHSLRCVWPLQSCLQYSLIAVISPYLKLMNAVKLCSAAGGLQQFIAVVNAQQHTLGHLVQITWLHLHFWFSQQTLQFLTDGLDDDDQLYHTH